LLKPFSPPVKGVRLLLKFGYYLYIDERFGYLPVQVFLYKYQLIAADKPGPGTPIKNTPAEKMKQKNFHRFPPFYPATMGLARPILPPLKRG